MEKYHREILEQMENDPNSCKVCGGWLGRKPGTKPFCTARNCPGYTAVRSPAPKGTAGRTSIFPDQKRDDLEEATMKASPFRSPHKQMDSRAAAGSGAALGEGCAEGAQSLRRDCAWILHRLIAGVLLVLNVLAILFLILLPVLPDVGMTKGYELCFDIASSPPAIRLDRRNMVGGPCFKFGMTFVDPEASVMTQAQQP
mmetsp:Transcript_16462/g.42234  ORF Transcript_16462/g.42234 Transcript_16462/m.42234 type:complete len:199 (-) Transcript_16462:221-817(-)